MVNKGDSSKQLGLWTLTSLVVGGMIGSAIFSIPTTLAPYGGISLLGWAFASAGALVLAKVFSKLSAVIPAIGGPYAFSRKAFGDLTGFIVAWGYWISIWTTNAAITITFVSYLSVFFPVLSENSLMAAITGLATLWSLTLINSHSVKSGGNIQVVFTILKLLPILAITIVGFFFFEAAHFIPFNRSGSSSIQAITITTAFCLYAFVGFEAATLPAGNVKNPAKTIPKATIIGTIFVTAIYILSSLSLFGILSPDQILTSVAPYSDAAANLWGEKARYLVAAAACLSAFGALNGWVLLQGQLPLAMAKDDMMPKIFSKTNKNSSPSFGILISSVIVSVLLIANQSKGLNGIYAFVLLISAVTVLISYLASSLAFGKFMFKRSYGFKPSFTNILLLIVSVGFSIWMFIGSGLEANLWSLGGIAAGLPIYYYYKHKKK
ncbi:MAG: APA family basic amino acid/polyamine antiporter [Roseivirga sp.]|jgi:APA family basic amino acid/polyamine antiporter